MKNNKFLTLFFFLLTLTSFSQNGRLRNRINEKKDQIKALKIAFITSELNLTSDEAVKFWPLFNAFEDKQQEIRKQKLKSYMDRLDDSSMDKLSEKEATTMLNQMENTEDELYQLRKKFVANLKTVLPSVKILKLKKAEEEFSKKLLKQYRDKKVER